MLIEIKKDAKLTKFWSIYYNITELLDLSG